MVWFGVLVAAAATGTAVPAAGVSAGDALAADIELRVNATTGPLLAPPGAPPAPTVSDQRVRTGTWTEEWPGPDGGTETRTVTGELWTDAIQASLDRHGSVYLPRRPTPYYLDGPIVLRSGCRLLADRQAEFRLKPGTSTCLVRNADPFAGGQGGPVPTDRQPDSRIVVEGGVWTTLRTGPALANGNSRGRADARDSVAGAHGVMLFCHVRGLAVRNVTIRQGTPFGLQLAAVSEFLVDGVTFEDQGRDGVHIEGGCHDGIVRNLSGVTHDDFVSLNAWDWRQYSMTFGPIERILVERLRGSDQACASLRLLPGTKGFPGGTRLDCPVRDCVFRDLTGLFDVKLYDQPNLELGAANDFSDPIGRLANLCFQRLTITRPFPPATLQVHADVDGLTVADVTLAFAVTPDYRLIAIGPQSMTYKHRADDPATWAEIFSPDRDCTVRNLVIGRVGVRAADGSETAVADPRTLVRVVEQALNPDYPKTTPRGGTGKGRWLP